MMTTRDDADGTALTATLCDLLQLEHDALPAYGLALLGLRDEARRERLAAFRDDHRRHVAELSDLIRARGGWPLPLPHLPTGPLKLALQAAGLPGGERAVLLAFRANEWQSREKYARAAAAAEEAGDAAPPEVAAVLRRAAADEAAHYAWAVESLGELGLGDDTPVGMANGAFARVHGLVAEGIESVGRAGLAALMRLPGRRP